LANILIFRRSCHLGEKLRGEDQDMERSVPKQKLYLTYSHMGMYFPLMPRASTTSDAFNAVAEPRRRDILNYLALQERSVGEIVDSLSLEQPSVSKHLRVLKDVGLVHVRRDGRRMLYRTNAEAIRPLHEWTATFERFWRHQLNRIKERAERKIDPSNSSDLTPRSKHGLDSNKN
jgi:DNA-binding transcriptional ArsR family regulator